MIRWILLVFFLLATAIFVGVQLEHDPGQVQIYFQGDVWQTSLGFFAIMSVGALIATFLTIWLIVWIWQLPSRLRAAARRKAMMKARRALTQGLIEIAEGQWRKGERRLVKYAAASEMPMINYLAAARAAQLLREDERRDAYLKAAYESTPAATVAVLLTQAELQMAHEQYEHALATLRRLQEIAPGHAFGLRLLARVHEALGDWRGLEDLLPRLRKTDVIREDELERLEIISLQQAFRSAINGGEAALERVWSSTPRRLRRNVSVVTDYARALMKADAQERAESVLRETLRREWDNNLILLYGDLKTKSPERQLGRVEQWLKERGDDPSLLAAAGTLCASARLWGKARSYLETSARLQPHPDTYRRLGKLLQELGQPEAAMKAFRQGLELCPLEKRPR